MAKCHGFFNSFNITDFRLKNVDKNAIKLLSNGSKFIYDGNRIKWTDDLDSLKGMAKKNLIDSFERDSKTMYTSLLQNFYICFTSGDILT